MIPQRGFWQYSSFQRSNLWQCFRIFKKVFTKNVWVSQKARAEKLMKTYPFCEHTVPKFFFLFISPHWFTDWVFPSSVGVCSSTRPSSNSHTLSGFPWWIFRFLWFCLGAFISRHPFHLTATSTTHCCFLYSASMPSSMLVFFQCTRCAFIDFLWLLAMIIDFASSCRVGLQMEATETYTVFQTDWVSHLLPIWAPAF